MRKRLALVLGVFVTLLVSGCGQQATSSGSATKLTVEEGTFKFALSGMAKPYNYTDKDGKLAGFDVDVAMEVGKRLGLTPVPVQTPWGSILQGLKANKYDAIIGGMSITEEREKQVDFSQPYLLQKAVMFVNEKNSGGIKSKDDLKGKVVGVVTASTYKEYAQELIGPEGKVKEYETDQLALQELNTEGRVDVVITDLGVGMDAIKNNQLPAVPIGEPLFVDKCGIPVQEGNKALLDAINKALDEMKQDGTYLAISQKWFNKDMLSESN
ncbi:transporter substrate-binding domain-containing protein [Brevibacillus parabrevis]|uniref:transporter substrate-binding domain-containing protein n=1 Tax=Brevibacillus parabrevis TaxID=54914 RepID=UPI0023804D7A|nr:transporter substrate-binding domain-containing protein [Brevibacillus parabrevis]MED2253508.1 transporter substrate-binding domain-containing protein [Brevibacillus parabrevis]WDV95753.1 transporter substrate-binding domain-containing protein [Brevibacillus parabrevis]